MAPSRLVAVGAIGLMLVACGSTGTLPSREPIGRDPAGAWQLTSGTVDGQPPAILDANRVTAVFDDSTIGGVAACNYYGARLTVLDNQVRIEVSSLTAMACVEPAMELEALYLGALPRVDTIAVTDGELRMTGSGIELVFARLEPPPTAELLDTVWLLETLLVGEVAFEPDG